MKHWVLHPFLLILYPVLFLYDHNINQLTIRVLLLPLIITWLSTVALYLLLSLWIKNKYKRGIFLSLLIFMVFSYGHLLTLILSADEQGLFFLLYLSACLVASWLILKSKKSFQAANVMVNLTAVFLLLFTLFNIVGYEFRYRLKKYHQPKQYAVKLIESSPADPSTYPDIYYLIFDRYGSTQLLADSFHFNNTPFDRYLKDRGFYIASHSKANYPYTFLSLASSLNMQYLDFLRSITGPTSDKTVVYRMIKDSVVVNFLKAKGYRYYNLGNWWQPSRKHPHADKNILLNGFKVPGLNPDEFSEKLLKTTLLYHLFTDLFRLPLIEPDIDMKRILYQFEELEKIGAQKNGPKFVFSHSLSTHPPFYFDSQGNLMQAQEKASRPLKELYEKSIAFTNRRLKKIVDTILAGSRRPVVIIIQADEGPWADILGDARVARNLYRRSQLKASIFNAYYVSPACKAQLYNTISPVNTFRIIFNHYFNTRLPLLPDRVFLTLRPQDLYQFTEITHRLIYGNIIIKKLSLPAEIFLDGREVDLIDSSKIRNVKPGNHLLKIVKQGFEPWQQEVIVEPGKLSYIILNLRPQKN